MSSNRLPRGWLRRLSHALPMENPYAIGVVLSGFLVVGLLVGPKSLATQQLPPTSRPSPPHPNLVARHKNGLPCGGASFIYQGNPVIVVQHLGPRSRRLVDVSMKIPSTPLVGAGDYG